MRRKSKFRLTSKQLAALETFRDNAREADEMSEWLRATALLMVSTQDVTRENAAKTLGVSSRSIFIWQHQYQEHGLKGIKNQPRPGKARRLTPAQLQEFREFVKAGPVAAGLDSGIWTSAQLAEHIAKQYGVKLSTSMVRKTLHFLGFSVQYPKKNLPRRTPRLKKCG